MKSLTNNQAGARGGVWIAVGLDGLFAVVLELQNTHYQVVVPLIFYPGASR